MENQEQGSDWWLNTFRKEGIGGSDVAVLFDCSPYKTRLQLYEEKISTEPAKPISNFVMELGSRAEPIARAQFESIMGKEFPPALVILDGASWIRASLDGWNKAENKLVEFKYTGKAKPVIPKHHILQIQLQLLASDAWSCYYQAFDFKDEKVILHECKEVFRDPQMQSEILRVCSDFWHNHVLPRVPPMDSAELKAPDLKMKLEHWKQCRKVIELLEAECNEVENYAKSFVTEKKMHCAGIEFTQVSRKGNVNYKIIKELEGIDLERYRGPSVEFIQMKEIK